MKALVTERVGKGVAWMPFHFGGWFMGADLRDKYPKGADPIVLGESANTITAIVNTIEVSARVHPNRFSSGATNTLQA